jgi:uncharacterized protein YndB with AHSA1/START domain
MKQDEIRKELELDAPVARVWEAITTVEGLSSWFGDAAEIELAPGGRARFAWTELEGESHAIIDRVEPPNRFAFRWDAIRGVPVEDVFTTVDFHLESVGGGTRLTMVESGFASIPEEHYEKRIAENTGGWDAELNDLVEYLSESMVG